MKTARNFFDQQEQALLIGSIALAELKTSGEIRLHIENICFGSEIKRAEKVFTQLKMQDTKERNGVLIYMAVLSRKIAVVGDEGIHQKLGNEFWKKIVDDLIKKFKESSKALALSECISDCGEQLGKFFPRKSDDTNELTNTISF